MTMPPFVTSKPIYETIAYSPGLKDTTDLEAATKTITATEEATGTGNADYSAALTLGIPSDARMVIKRIATRLSVTIDSDDGTHDLKCRVYVDEQDANHMLFDLSYTSTGNQLSVQDCLTGIKETIFNLLKDGNAHTFYFFFWSPGNHSPVISVCQLWEAVGQTGRSYLRECLGLTHTGYFEIAGLCDKVGTGGPPLIRLIILPGCYAYSEFSLEIKPGLHIAVNPALSLYASVSTDMVYIYTLGVVLRSN